MHLPILLFNATRVVNAISLPSADLYVPSTCEDIHRCRTIWNIVWSCLVTISACIWVAVHPNMPHPEESGFRVGFHRITVAVVALLVPEFVLIWTIRQWVAAGNIAKAYRATANRALVQTTAPELTNVGTTTEVEAGGVVEKNEEPEIGEVEEHSRITEVLNTEVEADTRNSNASIATAVKDNLHCTRIHGFFIIMGGFYLYDRNVPCHPLHQDMVETLVKAGSLDLPSEVEIQNRSKGDGLSKLIVLGQTLWFVMQCIARAIQGLPVTELEIVTLAYTTVTLGMYIFWWHKPLNAGQPVKVLKTSLNEQGLLNDEGTANNLSSSPGALSQQLVADLVAGFFQVFEPLDEATDVDLSKLRKVPAFYAGKLTYGIADLIAMLVAIVFGSIHCIAWAFIFPSHAEQLLWRISSIIVVSIPGFWALITLLFFMVDDDPPNPPSNSNPTGDADTPQDPHSQSSSKLMSVLSTALGILLLIFPILIYIVARIVLLVLAFTTLRSLSPDSYKTVYWLTFIPHI